MLILLLAAVLVLNAPHPAHSDAISMSNGGSSKELRDVIVVSQKPKQIVYYALDTDGTVRKHLLEEQVSRYTDSDGKPVENIGWYLDGTYQGDKVLGADVLPGTERAAMVRAWGEATSTVLVERLFGPPLTLVAAVVRYPLPPDVTYLLGSPNVIEGPALYVGTDAATATRVFFHEVASVELKKGGLSVLVTWKSGQTSEGPSLPGWQYDKHRGGPPVVAGFDIAGMTLVELPLRGLRRLSFTQPES